MKLSGFWKGWLVGALVVLLLAAGVYSGVIYQSQDLSGIALTALLVAWFTGFIMSMTSTKYAVTHWERTGSGNIPYEVTDQKPTSAMIRGIGFSLFLFPIVIFVVLLIVANSH